MAEHDVGLLGTAEDQVVVTIAVDISRRSHRLAEGGILGPLDREPRSAEIGEVDVAERPGVAKNHIGLARLGSIARAPTTMSSNPSLLMSPAERLCSRPSPPPWRRGGGSPPLRRS